MEQRKNPRFPVRFRSSFTSLNIVGGDGNITDLSLRGCRVEVIRRSGRGPLWNYACMSRKTSHP